MGTLAAMPSEAAPWRLCGIPHKRHSFAVRTLIDFYRSDADVAAGIAVLGAYLGHVNPAGTYWYLSASPELMELAAQRLENRSEAPR
jgi:hypothetical protein